MQRQLLSSTLCIECAFRRHPITSQLGEFVLPMSICQDKIQLQIYHVKHSYTLTQPHLPYLKITVDEPFAIKVAVNKQKKNFSVASEYICADSCCDVRPLDRLKETKTAMSKLLFPKATNISKVISWLQASEIKLNSVLTKNDSQHLLKDNSKVNSKKVRFNTVGSSPTNTSFHFDKSAQMEHKAKPKSSRQHNLSLKILAPKVSSQNNIKSKKDLSILGEQKQAKLSSRMIRVDSKKGCMKMI